jgi:CARDB
VSGRGHGCPRWYLLSNFRRTSLFNRGVRRTAVTALLIALFAAAPAAAQAPVFPLAVKAKLTDCHTGPLVTDRFAVFVGQMPALQGTRRMWMRFDLFERTTASGRWQHVQVPKFGTWQKSLPGKPGFIYEKRVDQLQAPADYRAEVRFRWYDAHGTLQRQTRRRTRACHEPDPRPDLAVGAVTATDAGGGRLRYAIRVRNDGRSDVGPFEAVLSVDGTAQPPATVAGLPAGGATKVIVVAPACAPGSRIQIALDPGGTIDEARETNNAVSRACPTP